VNFTSVINKNVFHKPKELTIGVNAEAGYNFKKNYWLGAKLNVTNVSYKDNYQDTTFFAFLNNQNHLTVQAIPYGKIKFKNLAAQSRSKFDCYQQNVLHLT
jgi:hypothetical protein